MMFFNEKKKKGGHTVFALGVMLIYLSAFTSHYKNTQNNNNKNKNER